MLEFTLKKHYRNFALNVEAKIGADWLVLLAPSGAGKSLTLNMLAGLVRPDDGRVQVNGEVLFDKGAGVDMPIRRRRIGYAFQQYGLFPHLNVEANIAYGIPPAADAQAEVMRWLRFFHLVDKRTAYPGELSGGQQQRVALARALASAPRILLLDEPLSALDPPIREGLQRELAALKGELSIPVVLVTHDFHEAQLLGDRMIVLDQGRVVEAGAKEDIFARPRRHETASFLGVENVMAGRVQGVTRGGVTVEVGGLTFRARPGGRFAAGDKVYCCVRAQDVRLVVDKKRRPNSIGTTVSHIDPREGTNRVLLAPPKKGAPQLVIWLDDYVLGRYGIHVGSRVNVWLPPERIMLCE
ncbi:MAG: ABC transporter ATP-binding protein [SAR324 cluster bacterium]|nr:ABC transporter ATP-binding protein [SAR324 cluster bacterium]